MSELAIMEDSAVVARAEEQLVTMTVEGQLFGLPILSVQDIVETDSITRVPLAPSAISGVMNLRGRIVTVVDLRRILGRDEYDGTRMGVTVEYQNDLYTILVDEIGEVRSLDYAAFEPPPATVEPALKQLCTGVYRLEDELLTVLDVERILASETIAATPPVQFIARREKDAAKEVVKPKTKRIGQSDKSENEKAETDAAKAQDAKPDVARKAGSAETKSAIAKKEEPVPALEHKDSPGPVDSDSAADKSIYELLGGEPAIDAAVEAFYTKVLADSNLADFFEGVDMDRQRKMQKDFLTMATGGPSHYTGRSLRAAHARLVEEKGLDGTHFDAVGGHLKATLEELRVPEDLIAQALDLVGGVREDVLAGPEAPVAPAAEPVAVAAPEPVAPEPLEAEPPVAVDAVAAVEQPLFDEIGGGAVVAAVAKTFYEQALEDAVLGAHYADADLAKQQTALVTFLTNSLGDSPSPANGHEWLVSKKGMGDDGFNRCLELFEAALQGQNVPEGLIFLVLAAVERNRESIVD